MTRLRSRIRLDRLILRRSYTLKELSEALGTHIRTAQSWHREGMKPIDETSRPLLFLGGVAKKFVRARSESRKCKLGADEFYCHKCKYPRKSRSGDFRREKTLRRLGRWNLQILVRGVCEVCRARMARLAAEAIVETQGQVSD